MEKTTTATMTATSMSANALDKAKAKTVKSLQEKKPVITGVQYDPKKVKIAFSKDMTATLSAYYAIRMELCKVSKMYQNNIKVYQARIDAFLDLEKPTAEQKKDYESNKTGLLKSQVCYKYFKSRENKAMREVIDIVTEDLYNAYVYRFNTDMKPAFEKWFKGIGMTMDNSLFNFVDKCLGVKSASASKRDEMQIDNLGKGAFRVIMMDILLQLAIDKSALSRTVIEATFEKDTLVTIDQFDTIVVFNKPSAKTTIKEYLDLFAKVGITVEKNAKKDEIRKAYKKGLRDGMFVEM